MKKQVLFLIKGLEGPRAILSLLSAFRRALICGALLFAFSGCTAGGLKLLSQLEANDLKKIIIRDRYWCRDHVGADRKLRQDLCNDFFASLRITSHCVEMRVTEPVEQEYCERFLYRMLIRPTRFFGQEDNEEAGLTGKGGDAGPDWFDEAILDDFLHDDVNARDGKPATPSERKLILKDIAEDFVYESIPNPPSLSQGIREQDRVHDAEKTRNDDLAGWWRGTGSRNHLFRLKRLFGVSNPTDAATLEAAIGKLKEDIDTETAGVQSFLSIALAGNSFNIRAVQWIDDFLFKAVSWESDEKEKRKLYLKSWCSLHWETDTDQKMMNLHETTPAWHEDNHFFVQLLAWVLRADRPGSVPNSASWWEDWSVGDGNGAGDTAWAALEGETFADKVKGVLDDGEWRLKTCNNGDLPFEPF